ncbi:hypothetical protein BDU57DRAFT_45739 [Ampelomyces quisqualis]|uniref:Uncharacterized protein n=1 Tax=Ampelomyces quisqualis TaxID=50730 RepID=A0A6A5R0U9_AMPQU|nr:hypothetical protein BDU57DRAFT_45739 [Ampelomyces quisqualis]
MHGVYLAFFCCCFRAGSERGVARLFAQCGHEVLGRVEGAVWTSQSLRFCHRSCDSACEQERRGSGMRMSCLYMLKLGQECRGHQEGSVWNRFRDSFGRVPQLRKQENCEELINEEEKGQLYHSQNACESEVGMRTCLQAFLRCFLTLWKL